MSFKAPIEKVKNAIARQIYQGSNLDSNALDFLGIYLIKNAISKELISKYLTVYNTYKSSEDFQKFDFHLTKVLINNDNLINNIVHEPEFKSFCSQFFEGNVGVENIAVFKKDAEDTKPFFLHNDIGYRRVGLLGHLFLFVPLTQCGPNNGGMSFYPGTHHFGYLGDVGEIDPNILPPDYPCLVPDAEPGDVLVLHPAIWHSSVENKELTDRVYLHLNIRHANDPYVYHLICGEKSSEWELNHMPNSIFKSSRTQKLLDLYKNQDNKL